jgi:hypothetical protein
VTVGPKVAHRWFALEPMKRMVRMRRPADGTIAALHARHRSDTSQRSEGDNAAAIH